MKAPRRLIRNMEMKTVPRWMEMMDGAHMLGQRRAGEMISMQIWRRRWQGEPSRL